MAELWEIRRSWMDEVVVRALPKQQLPRERVTGDGEVSLRPPAKPTHPPATSVLHPTSYLLDPAARVHLPTEPIVGAQRAVTAFLPTSAVTSAVASAVTSAEPTPPMSPRALTRAGPRAAVNRPTSARAAESVNRPTSARTAVNRPRGVANRGHPSLRPASAFARMHPPNAAALGSHVCRPAKPRSSSYPFDTPSMWSSSIFAEPPDVRDQPGNQLKPADATVSRSLTLLSKAQVNGVLASAGLRFRT